MATCQINGNSDMYGLGIRIGYYLQWYSAILAAWIAPSEVPTLRVALIFFTSATFLATIIQATKKSLEAAETYIILLLTFGSSLYLLPLLLWRFITGFNPKLDPSRFPRAKAPGSTSNHLYNLLVMGVLSFQIWFWVHETPPIDHRSCQEFGFLFTKVRLNSHWFRALNIALATAQLAAMLALRIIRCFIRKPVLKDNPDFVPSKSSVLIFQVVDSSINTILATTIVAATELTIRWNKITSVGSSNSAGQLIPIFLGVAAFTRVIYRAYFPADDENGESGESVKTVSREFKPTDFGTLTYATKDFQ